MIHHKHNQQWSDDNKMQICFKYSPTLDLNELRAVNKSQNFYQVFPSAAENISIIIILNSENFYIQSCTLCHLTCKNGVKEPKSVRSITKPTQIQQKSQNLKWQKESVSKDSILWIVSALTRLHNGILHSSLFRLWSSCQRNFGKVFTIFCSPEILLLFANLTNNPIIFANFEDECPAFTLDSQCSNAQNMSQ